MLSAEAAEDVGGADDRTTNSPNNDLLGEIDMIPRKLVKRVLPAGCVLILLAANAADNAGPAHYSTPDDAFQALLDAAALDDPGALANVLGPEIEELRSGDPVADANERADFVEAANVSARIEQEDDDYAILTVGPDDWPFPIPLVRDAEGWRFDVAEGKEELLDRRIGLNELSTIEVLRVYVEAQYEYAQQDRNGDGAREYARGILSSQGTRDGLYWPTQPDEPESPMGPLVAEAVAEGYRPVGSTETNPYHGYLFRSLASQSKHAPGGTRDYINDDGHQTQGFALLAYPAEYGQSGIMTFMVNHLGVIFQKDLGEDTLALVAAIKAYDPDDSWSLVTD
jgi:hypothetical protein